MIPISDIRYPISDTERRRAFSIWLRTGRVPSIAAANGVELKFNPWHDPADGRFTFAGSGRNYGQNGSGGFTGGGGGSGGGAGASSTEPWGDNSPSITVAFWIGDVRVARQPGEPGASMTMR